MENIMKRCSLRGPKMASTTSMVLLISALCLCLPAIAVADAYTDAQAAYKAKKFDQAIKLYTQAAVQGHGPSQTDLAVMYFFGRGVKRDFAAAGKWHRMAADQGQVLSQTNLAVMYDNGQGVPRDYGEAAIWYAKAAMQGDAYAQNALGARYQYGKGVAQDLTQAVHWYGKAGAQGVAMAQFNLAYLHETGQGTAQSFASAATWYQKGGGGGAIQAGSALYPWPGRRTKLCRGAKMVSESRRAKPRHLPNQSGYILCQG
jgi:hypothetical protein